MMLQWLQPTYKCFCAD